MKKGFTLIEVLIVVLIIGVLAGVALPQYKKSKEKAEAVELQILVKTLHESQQRYYMVHNTFAKSFDDLDMDYSGYERNGCPNFTSFPKSDCLSNGKNSIFISTVFGIASYGGREKGRYKWGGFLFQEEENNNLPTNKLLCYESYGFCSRLLNCEFVNSIGHNQYYYCPF